MKSPSPAPDKKSYETPHLALYGCIHEVTQAIANNTKNADGGSGKTSKTG